MPLYQVQWESVTGQTRSEQVHGERFETERSLQNAGEAPMIAIYTAGEPDEPKFLLTNKPYTITRLDDD